MARIFDVVEHPHEMEDELVHRIPDSGSGDFRIGSQVIVRESQAAVFFRDGKALDVFKAGRHTIATANIPLLVDLIGKAFGDRTPFTAEVYFVAMREFLDQKWGTPQPIVMETPGVGLGWLLLQGFGTYSFQVEDPQQFVTQVVGQQGNYGLDDIEDDLRSRLLRSLSDMLGEMKGTYRTIQDIIANQEEISAGVRAKVQAEFEARGLKLKSFVIELTQEALNAGFFNIDIDTSTLVDLSKKSVSEQQQVNSELSALFTKHIREIEPEGITTSIGGEIGEVGGRNSNAEELSAYVDGLQALLPPKMDELSKISVQTGTSHGGYRAARRKRCRCERGFCNTQ